MTAAEHTITLRDTAELVRLVPLLLGFRPRESLVVLCLRGRRAGPVMRVDLPRGGQPDGGIAELADHLAIQASAHGDSVALFGYSGRADALDLLRPAVAAMFGVGLSVLDAMVVTDDSVGFLPGPNGQDRDPVPLPETDRPDGLEGLRARIALSGRTVLADRAEIAASIRPPGGSRLRRARQAMRRARAALPATNGAAPADPGDPVDPLADALDQIDRCGSVESDTAAAIALLLQRPAERDATIGRLLGTRGLPWVPVLVSVLGLIPDDEAADVAVTLALLAYRAGDGALANLAIDRCVAVAPAHRLGTLVAGIIAAGLPPHHLDDLADLTARGTGAAPAPRTGSPPSTPPSSEDAPG